MSFLKKLFGDSGSKRSSGSDDQGFFLYVQCDNCGSKVRLRVHKQNDLNQADGGYVWMKTIIDNKCFRPMHTVVHFDKNYRMTDSELGGGRFISLEEYEAPAESQIIEQPETEE
jgi:hypothetical protein